MAAAFFNLLANQAKARGISAGTTPCNRVHPEVVTAMRELDVDLEGVKPRLLTEELAREADVLVTMGCGEQCPFVPGVRREDWELRDPKGLSLEMVRQIRDEVRSHVAQLVEDLAVS
jgi:arsenate reductase